MDKVDEHHTGMLLCQCDAKQMTLNYIKKKKKLSAIFSIFWVPDWSVANSWLQVKLKGFYFKCEEKGIKSESGFVEHYASHIKQPKLADTFPIICLPWLPVVSEHTILLSHRNIAKIIKTCVAFQLHLELMVMPKGNEYCCTPSGLHSVL